MELSLGGVAGVGVLFNPALTSDDMTVTWSSSDESVAVIEDGVVIVKGVGMSVITASVGAHRASLIVSVGDGASSILMGDVDGNGVVDARDAAELLLIIAELKEATPRQLLAGKVVSAPGAPPSVRDVTEILLRAVGLRPAFYAR
jgi:hypothetical protein